MINSKQVMKKTFYFSGIFALAAGFMTSCDKELEDDYEGYDNHPSTSTVKKLKVVTSYYGDHQHVFDEEGNEQIVHVSYPSADTFDYDDSGKKITVYHDGKKIYTYDDHEVNLERFNADGTSGWSGLVAKQNDKGYLQELSSGDAFEYDEKGYLKSCTRTLSYGLGTRTITYTWKDGDLVEEAWTYDKNNTAPMIITYHYTNDEQSTPIKNVGGLVFAWLIEVSPLYNTGVASKHLPVSKTIVTEDTKEINYEWAFDPDGYPIKMSPTSDSEIDYYTFVWK